MTPSSLSLDHIALSVPDVSCAHCVAAIDKALSGVDGISTVTTDLGTKQVTVSYDPTRVSTDLIAEKLDDAGYPVAGASTTR